MGRPGIGYPMMTPNFGPSPVISNNYMGGQSFRPPIGGPIMGGTMIGGPPVYPSGFRGTPVTNAFTPAPLIRY
jgi:hypothetical protein